MRVAEAYARTARNDMSGTPINQRGAAQRYREWFGVYSEARWNAVQNNFNRIYSAISGQQLGFDCGCTEPFFAFVYPNDPYNMTVCNAFWTAPTSGTDSKAGTIVHEVSHFTIVSDTNDEAYGQSACRALANSQPSTAIRNADSHEYFAENTPFLSMPAPEDDGGGNGTQPEITLIGWMAAIIEFLTDD